MPLQPEISTCLCNRIFNIPHDDKPKLCQRKGDKKFFLICSRCNFWSRPMASKAAAIQIWQVQNRAGCKRVEENWKIDYEKQKDDTYERTS